MIQRMFVTSVMMAILLIACSGSGNGGDAGSNEPSMAIILPSGAPASGAKVFVRRVLYRADTALVNEEQSGTADSRRHDFRLEGDGRLYFSDLADSLGWPIAVEVRFDSLVVAGILDSADTSLIWTLASGVTLSGSVQSEECPACPVYVQILGLERVAKVASDGAWSMDGIPLGNWRLHYVILDSLHSPREADVEIDAPVVSGILQELPVDSIGLWAWSSDTLINLEPQVALSDSAEWRMSWIRVPSEYRGSTDIRASSWDGVPVGLQISDSAAWVRLPVGKPGSKVRLHRTGPLNASQGPELLASSIGFSGALMPVRGGFSAWFRSTEADTLLYKDGGSNSTAGSLTALLDDSGVVHVVLEGPNSFRFVLRAQESLAMDGTPHHLAATWDSTGQGILWLDGVRQAARSYLPPRMTWGVPETLSKGIIWVRRWTLPFDSWVPTMEKGESLPPEY